MAVRGVVGVFGAEAMAAFAVGLTSLGVTGGHASAVRLTGPFDGDEASDDLLGLAAPDAVLLAGADREGQAVASDRAGLTDSDGLPLEIRAVGEERVVVGRHDLAAGGLITPAPDLGHAARPPCGHASAVARLTIGFSGAARERPVVWASRLSLGRCKCSRRGPWGS